VQKVSSWASIASQQSNQIISRCSSPSVSDSRPSLQEGWCSSGRLLLVFGTVILQQTPYGKAFGSPKTAWTTKEPGIASYRNGVVELCTIIVEPSTSQINPGFAQDGVQILAVHCQKVAQKATCGGRKLARHISPNPPQNMQIQHIMEEAGMDAYIDKVSNVRGRVRGFNQEAPILLTGSHYDTVKDAGKFDGMLGILVPIAAIKALLIQVTLFVNVLCVVLEHPGACLGQEGPKHPGGTFCQYLACFWHPDARCGHGYPTCHSKLLSFV